MSKRPSRIAKFFLSLFLPVDDQLHLLGDYEEIYHFKREQYGPLRAKSWYWLQLISTAPHFFMNSIKWSVIMFGSYFKIAIRNIFKHKAYSFINISGLAIGMACCILILTYVMDEMSYDRFHENSDRIYRVTREWFNSDGSSNLHLGHVAPPFKDLLLTDFGEIEAAIRIRTTGSMLVGYNEKYFVEDGIAFIEEDFFKIFSFELMSGNPETALTAPMTTLINQTTAEKYFGNEDPVGKSLEFDANGQTVLIKVVGVLKDMPENSHFHFDIISSFKTYEMFASDLQSFGSNNYGTYLLLPENYDINRMIAEMPAFIDRHMREGASNGTILHFQRLTDIHLHSNLDSEYEANSDIRYVYIFSAIAVFVLLIACINFMNLSTARSTSRAREVGLRKTVGAVKGMLVRQFLGETIIMSVVAMVIAVLVVTVSLPWFRDFTGKLLEFSLADSPAMLGSLLGITLLVGVLAGSYPAFFLSSFKPVKVLRGSADSGSKGSMFRKILVVFQFAISIVLIISMAVVSNQLDYVRNANLGFDKEQIVVTRMSTEMAGQYESIRERLIQQPGIINAARSKRVPSGRLLDSWGARTISGNTSQPVEFRLAVVTVSHDFLDTYGIELVTGRDFSREFATDAQTQSFIINEMAVKELGWTNEDAIDRDFQYGRAKGKIIGVMKDFHFENMRQPKVPMIFVIANNRDFLLSLRLAKGDVSETMKFIQDVKTEYMPNYPFDYYFIDERYDQQYRAEEKLGEIFGYFSLLAIVIACLGLYGLASFTAEKRTREIGIRKVLGASVTSIVGLLTGEFVRLVLISNLTAWPIAYFAMDRWLQVFAYRIDIGLLSFIAATGIALVIAVATVSWQAVRAALSNPVKAIKYE